MKTKRIEQSMSIDEMIIAFRNRCDETFKTKQQAKQKKTSSADINVSLVSTRFIYAHQP